MCRLVWIDGKFELQHRIDDPPGFFDIILAREERLIARHRVAEHAFIGVHLVRQAGAPRPSRPSRIRVSEPATMRIGADGDGHFGADAEAAVIRREA